MGRDQKDEVEWTGSNQERLTNIVKHGDVRVKHGDVREILI